MKWGWLLLRVVVVLLFAGSAQAQTFSCRFQGAPPNYTQVYSPLANSSTALSVSVRCRKAGGGAGKTINYTVAPSNGLNASGAQNRASLSGQFINYDLYTDSSCTIPWSGSGTIVLPGGGGANQTQTLNYYGCVPASQPVLPAAGTYADTVTMTLAVPDPAVTITGANPRSFTVGVTVNAACTLSTPPGSVNFGTYTAFQSSASTANTTFRTTCTTSTPYTMSLDTTSGVVSGLNYSLLLNTTSSGGTHPLGPVAGTGVPQTFYINGTMPANQAGTCPTGICAGTNTHTLTITY